MQTDFTRVFAAGDNKPASIIEIKAPYDGKLLAKVGTAGQAHIEQALTVAYQSFRNKKAWLPLPERITILEKLQNFMLLNQEELAVGAAAEGGKPLIDSRVEVARAIDGVKICIQTLRTDAGQVIPMQFNAGSANRIAFTQHEPIGVVVAISAFNHPVNLIIHQVVPAIAAGCPVIVKPSQETPLSCLRIINLLYEAGLPSAWCQALVISDNQLATNLVTDNRVAFLSFIGSARVGWMLRSKLMPGTRCALEHGGVAPVIIADDADIDSAVNSIAKGGFYHAGQVCVSVQRVFVHQKIANTFAEKLAEKAQKLLIGDPTKPETEVGPLIRHGEVDRVDSWIQEAVQGGAELLCGGKRISASCYACTVLLNPPIDAKVSTLEIFGPLVCVYAYHDLEQAIAQANALPFAFQGAVYTQNLETTLHVYQYLDASAIMVNDHTAFRVDNMPFAGLRQSGLGVGGIPYTLRDMQIEKMLVINGKR